MSEDLVPFLVAIGHKPIVQDLSLPSVDDPRAPSPWSPRAPEVQPVVDVATIRREAAEAGRAEGLRETGELRARLAALVEAMTAARAVTVTEVAELAAGAAGAVVEAWLGTTDHAVLFAPLVHDWCAAPSGSVGGTTATVHPSDADAMRVAIGDAAITVVTDPTVISGDVRVRGGEHELVVGWRTRISELRDAVACAIVAARDVQEP